jgi:hypothetical protein
MYVYAEGHKESLLISASVGLVHIHSHYYHVSALHMDMDMDIHPSLFFAMQCKPSKYYCIACPIHNFFLLAIIYGGRGSNIQEGRRVVELKLNPNSSQLQGQKNCRVCPATNPGRQPWWPVSPCQSVSRSVSEAPSSGSNDDHRQFAPSIYLSI